MQSIICRMGNCSDFELPEEILKVLPTDPYDQLDLARKITSIAIASRVSKLEAETSRLKYRVIEKEQMIYDLQQKISQLEDALRESNGRLRHALDEQAKLANERNSLASTVKKLHRDVAKLETFKKTLMQSLHEDDETPQAEMKEIMTAQPPMLVKSSFSSSSRDEDANGAHIIANQAASESMESSRSVCEDENHTEADGARYGTQKFSLTPYLTPRLTPTGTPKGISAAGSPKRSSPRRHSASGSPTRHQYDGRFSVSSSSHATAPNSPPHTRSLPARTPRVDGKEFFRQARFVNMQYSLYSFFMQCSCSDRMFYQIKVHFLPTLKSSIHIGKPERKPCAGQMRYLVQITKIYILHLMVCSAVTCISKGGLLVSLP